jgi:1,4-dihydroxy-2-naphthoate octaprenyltransferase
MKSVLNILNSLVKGFSNHYFRLIGLLWIFASFVYIGDPRFWTILGFGVIFTGIQSLLEKE